MKSRKFIFNLRKTHVQRIANASYNVNVRNTRRVETRLRPKYRTTSANERWKNIKQSIINIRRAEDCCRMTGCSPASLSKKTINLYSQIRLFMRFLPTKNRHTNLMKTIGWSTPSHFYRLYISYHNCFVGAAPSSKSSNFSFSATIYMFPVVCSHPGICLLF